GRQRQDHGHLRGRLQGEGRRQGGVRADPRRREVRRGRREGSEVNGGGPGGVPPGAALVLVAQPFSSNVATLPCPTAIRVSPLSSSATAWTCILTFSSRSTLFCFRSKKNRKPSLAPPHATAHSPCGPKAMRLTSPLNFVLSKVCVRL